MFVVRNQYALMSFALNQFSVFLGESIKSDLGFLSME